MRAPGAGAGASAPWSGVAGFGRPVAVGPPAHAACPPRPTTRARRLAEGIGYADDGEEVFEEDGDYDDDGGEGSDGDGDDAAGAGAAAKKPKGAIVKALQGGASAAGGGGLIRSALGVGGSKAVSSLKDEDKKRSSSEYASQGCKEGRPAAGFQAAAA